MVGDRDHLGLVLHDEHRVALVAQPQQQVVHPLDVVRVQPDGRLVEDVGDVGQRRPELADHLDALGLAARQRARLPVQAEVAQADLHEGVQGLRERGQQRGDRRLVEAVDPSGQVADLHGAGVGDADALDLRGAGRLGQPGPVALGARGEGDRALHERPDVRLHGLLVLGQHRPGDPRDQALVGHVDARDLHPDRLMVQEVVPLLLGELADRLVRVVEARLGVEPGIPAAAGVARDGDRALGQRLGLVEQLGEVDVGDGAPALAARAHPAGDAEAAPLLDGLPAALERDRARAADRGDVERERLGRADVRLPQPAEQDAQHRVGVGGGADRGPGVGPHPLLVHDDRGGQALEHVDVGPGLGRHEALHEGAVGLVDQPLRLGGDGVEDQGALARPGHAGEHRQAALGELDADVLEVVLARAVHADQLVTVGSRQRARLRVRPLRVRPRGHAHLSPSVGRAACPGPVPCLPDRLST